MDAAVTGKRLIWEEITVVFRTYGNPSLQPILLIHGMANDANLCYGRILPGLTDFCVILCELDGHTDAENSVFRSIEACCDQIEQYVTENWNGHLYGLSGFSMGATIAVELMTRHRIEIEKVVLDGAWCVKVGALAPVYTTIFCWALKRIKAGKQIPDFLIERSMGKGNAGIIRTFYKNIALQSIRNACRDVYGYELSGELAAFRGKVAFWYGSNEPYPRKSARLLKQYLPQMQVEVLQGFGHGQFLNQHPEEYAQKLKDFMK
jgi:pimeloyl-ACP methyl ester carboxylesterase